MKPLLSNVSVIVRLCILATVFVTAGIVGTYVSSNTPPPSAAPQPRPNINSLSDLQRVFAGISNPTIARSRVIDADGEVQATLPDASCLTEGEYNRDYYVPPMVSSAFVLTDGDNITVRLGKLRTDSVAQVSEILRTSKQNCVVEVSQIGYSTKSYWTRVSDRRFGDVSAIYRTAQQLHTYQGPYFDAAATIVYAISGRWIIRAEIRLGDSPGLNEVLPLILRGIDERLGTRFGTQDSDAAQTASSCGSVPKAVRGAPPLSKNEHDELTVIHDIACHGGAQELTTHMRGRFLDDSGADTPTTTLQRWQDGQQAMVELAKALENTPDGQFGALTFRSDDAAVLFDRGRGVAHLPWYGFVRHCSTAAPEPQAACALDRNGPLGGVDWQNTVHDLGCDPGGSGLEVDASRFIDVTGDGRKDAVLAMSCKPETGSRPQQLRVYDGDPNSPQLLATLLREQDGTDSRGLRVEYIDVSGGVLTVHSAGYRESDDNATPSLHVIDQFTWNGTAFVRGQRIVNPR